MDISAPIPVALARMNGYREPAMDETVARLLDAAGFKPAPSSRVLVKPNMVSPRNARLSNTHPAVVAAVCRALLDMGAKVKVGDSPALGTAPVLARKNGLASELAGLGVKVRSLRRAAPLRLTDGGCIGISADALEADAIVNLPRFKAHGQMRMTLAVKNLFGCVVGFRKALAHARLGDVGSRFESMILDVSQALPGGAHLLDGIIAMERTGPSGGDPYDANLLVASRDAVALDTAIMTMIGIDKEEAPVWREAARRGLPGADPNNLAYPLESPEAFNLTDFKVPQHLELVTFHPYRVVRGRVKSLCARFL